MNIIPTRKLARVIRAIVPTVLLGLALQATATAQVVYTNIADTTLTTGGNLYIDLGKNGSTGSVSTTSFAAADLILSVDSSYASFFGLTVNVSGLNGSTVAMGDVNSPALDGSLHIAKLAAGTFISTTGAGGGNMRYAFDSAKGEWGDYTNQAEAGYLAVSFSDNSDTYYGWVQMKLDRNQVTVYDFAYQSAASVGIAAGAATSAIPEPSTYAAMAGALSLGFVAWRRSRQAKSETISA